MKNSGISYEEPSPNSFSFNSPYGACQVCKGLGAVYQVSMDAILPDENLSINEGAIAPLGEEREAYVFKQVQQVARKHKINLDKPIGELPKKSLNILLYGQENIAAENSSLEVNMDEDIEVEQPAGGDYEGIVNMVKRWFAASNTSEGLRVWVEKFMELKTMPIL